MTRLGIIHLPYWTPEGLPDFARAADEAGFDELWLWEDCFASGGLTASAVALAVTPRIEVGIGVLPAPLRNVALTAMEATTLARLYPGRFHLGVGHGVLDWMGQVGVRAASPMTLLGEYVDALRTLLAGEPVSAEGAYVKLRDVQLLWPADPPPPIYVGAKRPKTLALAGERSDGTILTDEAGLEDVRAARSALDAAGPGRRLTVFTLSAGTAADTAARVRDWAGAGADAVVLQPAEGVERADFLALARATREAVPTGS